ncbi:CopY/TcrY family copper transport repressor [Tuanshanicoccus lijuaniae]|uniref:CopY/TcrY family copper transport repressor n=1 Tax=Aerococcaceae bacterium zg-1292 TaxID=2774330 RepID=UPI001936FC89|nr:CopY/TcrY family copper transport repressor [Aerococcaceae bacterium zg-1292]MBF6979304.1 CopY/TcrY family copper transport repressor [Aerococcaceae bacterium zg-BR22]MBS4455449.1 CopY/TcrY family copper transport repressor [Aerococcaceae bacterium zg-A91]MBS4457409.1 CopY/TcrY family copper transport repressor [Aerococcaceae bacterium zg-BR33]QQA36963.1 CopY/TcrY family copper transport repressor [Aerococcaceae bacterium zg-1292]
MDKPTISPAEWEIMRVVWAHHQVTSREILQVFQHILDWKEGTIKSLINRLIQKQLLIQDTSTKPYLYSAAISEEAAMQQELDAILSRCCTKERGKYIHYLLEQQALSKDDCQLIQQTAQDKSNDAPETIACQCRTGQCTCCKHH